MRRLGWSSAILLTLSCASSAPDRVGVRVYQAPLSDAPAGMPRGCRLLLQHPPVDMSELRMTGSTDPFHGERVRAAQAGGNVLLVRSRMIVPRMDYNCPAASPITDCPPSEGSWHLVVFEDYACSGEAMKELTARAMSRAPSSRARGGSGVDKDGIPRRFAPRDDGSWDPGVDASCRRSSSGSLGLSPSGW